MELFLRGDPEVGPAGGQAVVFPAALIVVGEELRPERHKRRVSRWQRWEPREAEGGRACK